MTSLTEGLGFRIRARQESDVIDGSQLTAAERAEFDYHNWPAIDAGTDSASFFRRNGELHDLCNFMRTEPGGDLARFGYQGYAGDSFFSGIAVRYTNDGETVISALITS